MKTNYTKEKQCCCICHGTCPEKDTFPSCPHCHPESMKSVELKIKNLLYDCLNRQIPLDMMSEKVASLFLSEMMEENRKTITRFEILRDRMQGCEEEHPDTHKVSLIEIPGWIEELRVKQKVVSD